MRVVNTDAKTHAVKTLEKCLQEAGRGKKRIYLEASPSQQRLITRRPSSELLRWTVDQ